jgi:hypothetical protein
VIMRNDAYRGAAGRGEAASYYFRWGQG